MPKVSDLEKPANHAAEAISPAAWKSLWGSAVGYAMDGFDLLILGFMLHPIAATLYLTPPQAASLVTATLLGGVLGGFAFGMLSDRFGRVRVLTWTIVVFAVATGFCGLATSYWDLLAWRTVAGLGLGGEFGIGMAVVAEAWPAAMRARASSYVGLGWQAGVLASALLTPLLLPRIGWRGMFAIGAVPAIAAWFIRRALHEPEVFVGSATRLASGSSIWFLVSDATTGSISLGMLILCSIQNFGYYAVMIWCRTISPAGSTSVSPSPPPGPPRLSSAWPPVYSFSAMSPIALAAARPSRSG
jgi:MFS family permease